VGRGALVEEGGHKARPYGGLRKGEGGKRKEKLQVRELGEQIPRRGGAATGRDASRPYGGGMEEENAGVRELQGREIFWHYI